MSEQRLIEKFNESVGEQVKELKIIRGESFQNTVDYTIEITTFDGVFITRFLANEEIEVGGGAFMVYLADAFTSAKDAIKKANGIYIPKALDVEVRIKERREERWL